MGIRIKDLNMDDRLKKWIAPIATFRDSEKAAQNETKEVMENKKYKKEDEFVAIAEGISLPLYIFTYNIEMTQFIYTDLLVNPD